LAVLSVIFTTANSASGAPARRRRTATLAGMAPDFVQVIVWVLSRHQVSPVAGEVTVMLWPHKATFMVSAAMAASSNNFFMFNNLLVVVHALNTNFIRKSQFRKKFIFLDWAGGCQKS
jgi:hypothetical protein